MNNERGAALLAGLKAGDLVTIRKPDGGQRAGRVHKVRHGWCICSGHPPAWPVTADNIVQVQARAV